LLCEQLERRTLALVNELLEEIERDKAKPKKTNAWE
jgi:hypothetical protein